MTEEKTIKASDCKCAECGAPAYAFWPACDPDIQSFPYCKPCLRDRQTSLLVQMHESIQRMQKA